MSMTPELWLERHSLRPRPEDARRLSEAAAAGMRIGILLMARNAAATIGRHLLLLKHGWPGGRAPWSEIVVADLGSTDATVEIAKEHGATVIEAPAHTVASQAIPHGDGLARALPLVRSEVLLVAPADLERLEMSAVAALLATMLDHPACRIAWGAESARGGVLSSLALRPLLAALCPELAVISDPASPLLAIRPEEVRPLPLARTNGYEAALAIDCWYRHGLESLAQVLTGPLERSGEDPRTDPTHAFHAQLAALEALRRAGRIQSSGEFGHVLPTPESWDDDGPRLVSRLEVFDWKEDETARNLKAWFDEKS